MFRKILEFIKVKRNAQITGIVLAVLSLIMIVSHHADSNYGDYDVVSIEVAKSSQKDIDIYLSALGTVTAENSANIVSQVNGQLQKILFKDGAKVKKDDLIAQIDSRIYQAQLSQYQGQLKKDQALLDNAKIDLKRYQDLWKDNSVSKQTLDTQIALVAQYEGNVQMDQALVDNAKTNLSFCSITAPFDGQMGIKLQTEGNMMQANITNIAVINSYDPIAVVFSVPEVELDKVSSEFMQNKEMSVEALDHNAQSIIAIGKLVAIDNQVDIATGTVKLKAEFENSKNLLFPNQFVNVRLRVKQLKEVTTVPLAAIQYGKNKNYVYLVEDNKAKIVDVQLGEISGGDAVIKSGIDKDKLVAVSGVDKLTYGRKVRAKEREEK